MSIGPVVKCIARNGVAHTRRVEGKKSARGSRGRYLLPPMRRSQLHLTILFTALLFGNRDRAFQRAMGQDRLAPGVSQKVLAEFSVQSGGGPLLIPVAIEVHPAATPAAQRTIICKMVVDTGANRTFVSNRFRSEFGSPVDSVTIPTHGGRVEVERFKAPAMSAGGVPLRPDRLIGCCDLRTVDAIVGERVDGLLGMDILLSQVLSIDFDEGRLRLHQVADPAFGRPVQLRWNAAEHGLVPIVFPDLGDGDPIAEFLIDTGGSPTFAGSIKPAAYERLAGIGLIGSATPASDSSQSGAVYVFGNRIKMKLGRLRGFSLGGYHNEDLVFGTLPVNCLGLGYLSRFAVMFDFPRGKMYLRPGSGFARADVFDLSAMDLAWRDGDVVVTASRAGGAAAAAGIREYDVFENLDGQKANRMTLFAIRRRLCIEGRHSVVVLRNGVEKQINLVLSQRPPTAPLKRTDSSDQGSSESRRTRR